jgi:excisionase family DNA binding protein
MVMSTPTRFLTVNQVSDLLQLSEVSVRRKIRTGEIPAVRLARHGRAAVRVPEEGLHDWLEAVRHEPPEAA